MGDARASHRIQSRLPRGGNAAAQLNPVQSERPTSRINPAAAYTKADRDSSAMAVGGHGDHAPSSVELGRNRRRSGTDDCQGGRQSEGAQTIANHGSPLGLLQLMRAAARFTSCKELAGYGSLKGETMGLKLIVVAYFTLVSMVFALGVIALSIDSTRQAKAVDNSYLAGR
jgi:hypothetical protein